ncbi:Gfo/Idh/MocA family oxidoreductase, partial [Acidobacteriota bacterium]
MNWGILGCGRIARNFAQGLKTLTDARLTAAASLTPDRAKTFTADFGVLKSYSNYESLIELNDKLI